MIPLNFLVHTAEPFIHLEYLDSANEWYAHKAVTTKTRVRQAKQAKCQNQQPVPAAPLSCNQAQTGKLQQIAKRKKGKTDPDKKKL